jgi:hypothetical protein
MEGFLIILIVLVVVALIAIYYLIINYRHYQLILKTETSTISWLNEGLNEIKGKIVSLSEQLISPFNDKPCVYYHFKVEQKKSSGKSSHYVSIIDDIKYQQFGVDDGSGIAIIDMQNADVQIKVDKKDTSGFFDPADEKQKSVLNKYNHKSKGFLFEKTLRYTEKYLELGDEIYVIGEVVGRENSKPLFRKGQFPLFVSDKSEHELLNYYRLRIIVSTVVLIGIALIGYFMYADQLKY